MMCFLLLLLVQFPSSSDTAWMEPAAFHLVVGDSRSNIEEAFGKRGWKIERDKQGSLIHDYGEGKTVTMEFRDDRLVSVRFELVSFRPQLSENWDAVVDHLRDRFGDSEVDHRSLFLKRTDALSIHAVLDDSLDSDLGNSGAGRILVRYFVPSGDAAPVDTNR